MIKKIILLIFLIFIISGCYNYVEINDLVIISGIGIDYKNEKYIVSAEALYQNKETSESNFEWGQIKEGTGKTISEAFENFSLSIEKDPYYAHLKVVLISTEVANNHFNDIIDFFLRNNDIRNIFSVVVTDEISPKEMLENKNEYHPVTSERIRELLENNIYTNYIAQNLYFKEIVSNYLSHDKDIALTVLSLKNKEPNISKLLIYSKEKPVGYLEKDESEILSLITNKKPYVLLKYKCENNNYITAKIYKSKTNYNIFQNNYDVNLNLNAEIIENNCNLDLENIKTNKKVTNDLIKSTNNNVNKLINKLKNYDSDLLGINKKYYNKYRNKNNNYFKDANYSINTNIEINKKGLTFGVN